MTLCEFFLAPDSPPQYSLPMSASAVRPLKLADNRVPVFYAGGAKINKFRAQPNDVQGPEDWVGSITKLPPSILPQGADPKTGTSITEEGFLELIPSHSISSRKPLPCSHRVRPLRSR
ncbi:MAG: hypothetical protein D4R83_01030 [Streptomycetaceae bacterium]|nr:MAG: hypothetical protein D4R83_01030 [Streptomycetaceae bacterium]